MQTPLQLLVARHERAEAREAKESRGCVRRNRVLGGRMCAVRRSKRCRAARRRIAGLGDFQPGANVLVQISRYERGQALPNAETLVSLAEALKTDTDVLLRGEASSQPPALVDLNLDLPLLERFRDFRSCPSAIADAVILLIDSVLTRGAVEQRLKKTGRMNASCFTARLHSDCFF